MRPTHGRDAESGFLDAVQEMLSRPEYLIPLAAAERQYRDHYYGLNSAALLEDLFFDALGNFIRQTRPSIEFFRPPTGQKGWDYSFDGLRISHKVSQGLGDIAALWDATKSSVASWSFEEPIAYVLGRNSPSAGILVEIEGVTPVRCRAAADLGHPYILNGRMVLIVRWPANGSQPCVLRVIRSGSDDSLVGVLPFREIWSEVAEHVRAGGAANEIDVIVTNRSIAGSVAGYLESLGEFPADISVDRRSGVYLLSRDLLQGLEVTSNNRAVLIPRAVVRELLAAAWSRGLFSPMPLWYWPFAQERPPDMYSAQRSEYEALFSARGQLS